MLNSPPQSTILPDFKNEKYRFTIPKSRTWQVEKQEEEEDHRQLQSVLCFTQARKATNVKLSWVVIYVKVIIYLLLYNLHECIFKSESYHLFIPKEK